MTTEEAFILIGVITGVLLLFPQRAAAQAPADEALTQWQGQPPKIWIEVARIEDPKDARVILVAREGLLTAGQAKFWDKMVYASPHSIGVYENTAISPENVKGSAQFTEMWGLHELDCQKNTYSTITVEFHSLTGAVVSRGILNDGPKPIQPKSLQFLEANLVCH